MEILRTEHLSKTYGEGQNVVNAVRDANLSVAKGEFVAIVGSSGSGKSTLMHMMGAWTAQPQAEYLWKIRISISLRTINWLFFEGDR